MKKTLIALMALAGVASATVIELDGSFYSKLPTSTTAANSGNCYVYIWENDAKGSFNDSKWDHLTKLTDTTLTESNWTPNTDNVAFIGYDFSYKGGKQVMTSNNVAITVTLPRGGGNVIAPHRVYLGDNVTLTQMDPFIFGQNSVRYYDFGDFSGTSVITLGQMWQQVGSVVNFSGNVTMQGTDFSYTLLTSTDVAQLRGTWNASGVSVKDANDNALTYTTDEDKIGKAGYYWIETQKNEKGITSFNLVAKAVPEPATATLSLLALAGLAARRRRR